MAARLLARRAYATAELRQRLEAMGYRGETAARTVARCVELGWVDDVRLAHDRATALRGRGAGRLKIEADLATRGLPPGVVAAAIDAASTGRGESAWAHEALASAGIDPVRSPERAWRLLTSRGFDEDVAAEVVGTPT